MSVPFCPRSGCTNYLADASALVCDADFTALASSCRGKKRLGEPAAAMIEGQGKGIAYRCPLCKQWHNGGQVIDRTDFARRIDGIAAALHADPRVGWRGLLNLADAWHPDVSERSEWHQGLDQTAAYA